MLHHESARCPASGRGGRLVGCRQRGAVITVVDPDAARRSLVAGELACPQPDCGGRLRVWSRALPRRVRGLDGTVVRVTHVLLPAEWLPRRGYDVEISGRRCWPPLRAPGTGGPPAGSTCRPARSGTGSTRPGMEPQG